MRKKILLVAGIIISLGCLYAAFRGISFQKTLTSIRQADFRWLLLAAVVYILDYFLRTWRWSGLLRPVQHISPWRLWHPLILGFFANNIFPFRIGEIVRAHITGSKFKISRTACFATIFLERLYDTLSFILTFFAVTLLMPFPHYVEKGAFLMGIACFGIAGLICLCIRYKEIIERWIFKSPLPEKWKHKTRGLFTNFFHGMSGMLHPPSILKAVLLSLVIWTLEGTSLYFINRSFPKYFSYPQSFFLLFMLGLAVLLPQAPGYVGTVELAGVTSLGALGFSKEEALPIILTIHVFQFSFIIFLGLMSLWKEGLSLRSLSSE